MTLSFTFSLTCASTSAAQDRLYLEGGLAATNPSSSLTQPGDPQRRVGAFAAGYAWKHGLGIEVRRSGYGAEASSNDGEFQYLVGVRIAVTEASLTYRPPFARIGRLAPAVSVGLARARVTDYWDSDTPREEIRFSANGLTGAMLADFRVVRNVSLLARVSAQRITSGRNRVGAAFDLDATTIGGGLRLWW